MNIQREIRWENPDLQVGLYSIIGTRQYQQDFLYYGADENAVLAAVCDGMGGMEGGERASRTAVNALSTAFWSRDKRMGMPEFFRAQAEVMNSQVNGLLAEDGKKLRAGTTIVAAAVQEESLFWLSVGDSRIYILRNDEILQVNREHNYRLTLKESLKSGVITKEQYEAEEKAGQAEALISYLGIGKLTLMDINPVPFEMKHGDTILLCSDGLYKSLTDRQIQALIQDNDVDLDIAARRLCDMALCKSRGGQDNTSVMLLKYHSMTR